ncbi:hypothetical protein BKA66DRAFT_192810 [Pyrenochaeta sp. MPI-SDFR-AT-0127]|nr:hypothetical protein BKA66DRAFT_192810 [Pyrenochaeta sp. MPI-SDFR-AT-0127]
MKLLVELFTHIESQYSCTMLVAKRRSLIKLSVLTPVGICDHESRLYTNLISVPQVSAPSAWQTLRKRIREALVKLMAIIGAARPLYIIYH